MVYVLSKLTQKVRFCVNFLRNKVRQERDGKKDKIYRCWIVMRNIGARRIFKIYVRRNETEKLEKGFAK